MSVDETYDQLNQSLIAELEEDSRFERKPPGVHIRGLGSYFSMYANTEPDGGLIAIGIEDDGTISGFNKYDQKRINDVERSVDIYCPEARYSVRKVPVINKNGEPDLIILIRIYWDSKRVVEDVEGNAYIRISDTRKRLTGDEKHELKTLSVRSSPYRNAILDPGATGPGRLPWCRRPLRPPRLAVMLH